MSWKDRLPLPPEPARLDREWLVPCAAMTAMLGIAAVALMPVAGYDHAPPYFTRFVNWMAWSFVGALLLLAMYVMRLWYAGVEKPFDHLTARFLATRGRAVAAIAGMALAGIDMLFFMWAKPELTALSPFWADQLWADIDKAIFLGMDPWKLFQGMDLTFHAWAYSFFWLVAIIATLVWLFAQPPSQERSASLLCYFALWSIFGPIGQVLGSSAGPIFYQRIGLGDRFAAMEANIPEVTGTLSDYLWHFYTAGEPAVGAGISAMPSLHIATVVWIYFVLRGQGSRIAPLSALFAFYIFAMSVALGWHYAIDGIAAAVGALATQWACRGYLSRRDAAFQAEARGMAPASS